MYAGFDFTVDRSTLGSDYCLEGQQPDCLNSFSNQVAIAQKKKVKNQKFDSEERGYFGVTKRKSQKYIVWIAPTVWIALSE